MTEEQSASLRTRMVDAQIRARGIRNKSVLLAMERVPRHRFVPVEKCDFAYEDYPLPIGYSQTISQPYIVAHMSELLEPEMWHKVLEIGTGSGYQAAILSQIVDQVFTVEIVEALSKRSTRLFSDLGYDNIHVKYADGYYGWYEQSPFDAIIVTAATEKIPPELVRQLKTGGRICIPLGVPSLYQELCLVHKITEDQISVTKIEDVRFVPLTRGSANNPQ